MPLWRTGEWSATAVGDRAREANTFKLGINVFISELADMIRLDFLWTQRGGLASLA